MRFFQEKIYEFEWKSNGAGPLWCFGSSCIATFEEKVFVSGWETLKDVPPLNCARWSLYQRSQTGWKKLYQDNERTIEPAPICILGDGRTFVSENPFMQEPEVSWGVTLPKIMIFCPPDYIKTKSVLFRPCEPVVLTEHSYRNFAADRKNSELFLYHSDRWN